MRTDHPGPAALIGALAWRTRREGLRYLLIGIVPFLVVSIVSVVPATLSSRGVNGAATFAAYASRYGAGANNVGLGIALLTLPGLVALFASLAVALVVRNVVGSEASRGGVEALLAGPYRPRDVMIGLLGHIGALAAAYWLAMSVWASVLVAVLAITSGATLVLTGAYLALVLVVPLLAAWAATGLALLTALLFPRLVQAGNLGLNVGGGGIGTLPTMLPGLAVLLVLILWAPHAATAEVLGIAAGGAVVIIVASVAVVARRFRPDAVLET